MRRSPSIEPFTPSPNVQLHPTLQAVLDSFDVQIEEELSRYRRQRRQPHARPQRQARLQDPTALGILNQSIQLPQLGSSLYEASEPLTPTANRTGQPTKPNLPAQVGVPVWSSQPPVPRQPSAPTQPASSRSLQSAADYSAADYKATDYRATDYGAAERYRVSAPNRAPEPIASDLTPAPPEPAPEPSSAQIASYSNQYDLSAYAPNSTLQRLMYQAGMTSVAASNSGQAAIAVPEENLEDYLASSEELLRSIAEETRQSADREPNTMLDTLLTPLGVGSMLLLLLSSTTLGYVMMNPASVGLSGFNNSSVPASQPAPTAVQTMRGPAAANQALPSPNLAADEFVDLGLDTLSTIPRSREQRPKATTGAKPASSEAKPAAKSASPSEVAVDSSAASSVEPPATVVMPTVVDSTRLPELPPAPAPQPSMSTVVVPARPPISETPPAISANIAPVSPEPIRTAPPPIPPAPLPAVEPAPSVATAPAPEAAQGRYYVMTDYSGDASLEQARTAVPDAYVRNLPDAGAKVQLGSFNDQAGAEGLRQQLQQQGIQAEVYQP